MESRITQRIRRQVRRLCGPAQVSECLGSYTHRAAISNHRLVRLENGEVAFRWEDYAHGNRSRLMTLDAAEFIRRFLLHVLPPGFVRLRHYGLSSNRHRAEKIAPCREPIAQTEFSDLRRRSSGDWKSRYEALTGVSVC
ncbi:MAG: hypothetical protein FJW35_07735 [Acidobacteria bacterium]|nr:hypothetical protein [Acidobacteriota bacterium]